MTDFLAELYLPRIAAARARMADDAALRALLDPATPAPLLERFLMQFAAHGVRMTAPVEGWIHRAGERALATGFDEVGRQLLQHARHEAGHDQLLVDDLHALAALWNRRRRPPVDAAALLAEPELPATRAYVALHERTIAGDLPVAQVAIELEIEHLSIVVGGPLLSNIGRVCGPEVLATQSFIRDHNAIDVGHTALNERIMDRVLRQVPAQADRLAAVGAEALATYTRFLGECLAGAQRWLEVNV